MLENRFRRVEMNTCLSVNPPRELVGVAERADELTALSPVNRSTAAIGCDARDVSRVRRCERDSEVLGERVKFITCFGRVLHFVPERHCDRADFPLHQWQ
jgi:hypothetical protein